LILPALLLPLLLGVVVATLIAAVVHLTSGRSARDLAVIWIRVQIGFWLAHLTAVVFGLQIYGVGDLQIVEGIAGALLVSAWQIVTQKRV